jgi:hypothetical protein
LSQSSNSLSSLTLTGLQREVNQLTWKGFTNKVQNPNHLHQGRDHKPYGERTKCPHHGSNYAYRRRMAAPSPGNRESNETQLPAGSFLMSGLKKGPLAGLSTMHP